MRDPRIEIHGPGAGEPLGPSGVPINDTNGGPRLSELSQNVATIGVPCPACDAMNLKEASWFRTQPDSLVCSGCGMAVPLGRHEYEWAPGAIEIHRREMDELGALMDLANKRLRGGR